MFASSEEKHDQRWKGVRGEVGAVAPRARIVGQCHEREKLELKAFGTECVVRTAVGWVAEI